MSGLSTQSADNMNAALIFNFSTSVCMARINTEKPSFSINTFWASGLSLVRPERDVWCLNMHLQINDIQIQDNFILLTH